MYDYMKCMIWFDNYDNDFMSTQCLLSKKRIYTDGRILKYYHKDILDTSLLSNYTKYY